MYLYIMFYSGTYLQKKMLQNYLNNHSFYHNMYPVFESINRNYLPNLNIFSVTNGEFRQYRGSREKEAFISFIEDKLWEKLEAIPSWKSPSSTFMSIISFFFKLSQILRVSMALTFLLLFLVFLYIT